ncbi:MAG TPA: hypothetical protein VIG25_00775 [Pyrinomonadaceae bacterium]
MFDKATKAELIERINHLRPNAARRWGRMTAPQMIVHLSDQMRQTLGDAVAAGRPGPLRNPLVRYLAIYWLPWPKGRIKGPPEAFVTKPTTWDADVATLIDLVNRFLERGPSGEWPDQALFGHMTGKSWGVFCHKHFNHHLTQFGV